jgi:MarR family transcriptional regulator, 2-MHQ and catechol-resistance regulon repressor
MPKTDLDDDMGFVRTSLGDNLDAMLVYNIFRTQNHLGASLDAGLRRRNLSAAQFNTLLALRTAGPEGLLMGEIGERLVVTKSNVTGLVDRLESQNLAVRSERPDRRATAVRLTDEGARLLRNILPENAELLSELTECLSRSEKETIIRLLTKLRRELRRRRKEE